MNTQKRNRTKINKSTGERKLLSSKTQRKKQTTAPAQKIRDMETNILQTWQIDDRKDAVINTGKNDSDTA